MLGDRHLHVTEKVESINHLVNNRHLMTGPEGHSEFCFPETVSGNIEVEGKQNSMFPAGPVIECVVIMYLPTHK